MDDLSDLFEMDDLSDLSEPTVHDRFDPKDDSRPSERVIRSVAVLTDTAPVELPPLYEAIDPEALDSVVDEAADGQLHIAFSYADTAVYFTEQGDLHVTCSSG